MRVTSKGQVTIPQAIREKLGIRPGTEVVFRARRGAAVLEKARGGRAAVERMRGRGTIKLTTDQIMRLTRER